MTDITHRFIDSNGIRMHIAEAGSGPLVLMCHGFPESWYSWRHQLNALAAAGFHAVAPDMRGYGTSDCPAAVEHYTLFHVLGDMERMPFVSIMRCVSSFIRPAQNCPVSIRSKALAIRPSACETVRDLAPCQPENPGFDLRAGFASKD